MAGEKRRATLARVVVDLAATVAFPERPSTVLCVRRGLLPGNDARAIAQWGNGGGFSLDGRVRDAERTLLHVPTALLVQLSRIVITFPIRRSGTSHIQATNTSRHFEIHGLKQAAGIATA